jgi:hypothetical protein
MSARTLAAKLMNGITLENTEEAEIVNAAKVFHE